MDRFFSSDGKKVGNEFRLNTYTEDDQVNPQAVYLSNGSFVTCWESKLQDGDGLGVYGQIFSVSGEKIGQEFQVNTQTGDNQYSAQIISLEDGNFVVCWQNGSYPSIDCDVYGQVFSASGERIGQEFRVNTYTQSNQGGFKILPLSSGKFVICWNSEAQDGSGYGVYGQIFSVQGRRIRRIGAEFRINTNTIGDQSLCDIASLVTGDFIVCWIDWSDTYEGYQQVYGQLFSLSGEKIGQEIRVYTVQQFYGGNRIVSLFENGFVVCWKSVDGVYGQLFSLDGKRIGKEFRVSAVTGGLNWRSEISIIGTFYRDFVVCWDNKGEDGMDVYVNRWPASPFVHSLRVFHLFEPGNDDIILSRNCIDLKWQRATEEPLCYPWEIQYKIYLDDNPDFTSPEIYEQDMDTTLVVQNLKPGRTYFWKVLAKNIAGDSVWSSDVFGFYVRPDVGVEEVSKKPDAFSLEQNYPNPFNASTEIRYELPVSGHVTVAIYDIKGRLVRVLVQGVEEAGSHSIVWDGKDALGKDVPSGIYLYKLSFKDKEGRVTVITRKMGLVR